jgi:type I restriction-modification system DNA methylase subunit
MSTNLQSSIQSALKAITPLSSVEGPGSDFRAGHLALLKTLGYESNKSMPIPDGDPAQFVEFAESNSGQTLHPEKARLKEWLKADILFQLTDEELSGQSSLFQATELSRGNLQSYLFFAIELSGSDYSRSALSDITRQINRLFPMPVMVLFTYDGTLSIAVINRRANKREAHKDVLGKVTLIHGIELAQPHRGHLEILESFSVPALTSGRQVVNSFDSLHAAWEEIFNVELLNKKFYRELSNWYFWAMHNCHFPYLNPETDKYDLFKDKEKVREHDAKNLIRLLTRILFVWFIKQKRLVPDSFFDPLALQDELLKDFDPESKDTNYYKAILQNLFFATLNQTHGKREFRKSGQHHNTTTLLRYETKLKDPEAFVQTVETITPFLNGGLFDCLDYPHPTRKGPQGGAVTVYEDGFSDRKDNPLIVPDYLFFGQERAVDLSDDYGDNKRKTETVRGLIHILNGYKFTIVENTPIEQEIALDPELLGQVFENLLASYNEETKTTARKQTGSFYTPRPIVDYMVDESLKAHLKQALVRDTEMSEDDALAGLDLLFTYTEKEHPFNADEVDALIRAIDACKILDPACGSGAFPMGTLQKLVYILGKLDPRDKLWERRQLAKVDKLIEAAQDIDDTTFRERAIADAQAQKRDIEEAFAKNELGYGRKLYLIENCLYGVDIQSIATQVSKLRFFISLIVEQTVDKTRENFGIRPLPNLETKFVTADTLIQIEKPQQQGELFELAEVSELQKELKRVRHDLFSAKTPRTKAKHRARDKELRAAIAQELKQNGWASDAADKLAAWDPYDQNASAPYFDPEWMFGLTGFDIVIGNPPYIQIQKFPKAQKDKWVAQGYETYAATADIYCLFYERGAQLLKDGGSLVYITSNKWMRAGYGEKLRKFLSSKVTVNELLDFWGILVFQAATVDTNVLRFTKVSTKKSRFESTLLPKDFNFSVTLEEYVKEHSTPFEVPTNSAENWAVLSVDRLKIRKLVEAQGIPLKQWNLIINYGVKTGLNDAFYITTEQRDKLIAEDPSCQDLILPLLRGRFIERYGTSWNGEHLINTHNGVKSSAIPPVNVRKDYPVLWRHLKQWEDKLRNRQDKGDHWSNLRNCAYLEDFSKPKIIYPEITKRLGFYYDNNHRFIPNNKGYIVTSPTPHLPYLTAFLNSSLFKCCYKDNFPTQGEDRRELRTIFFELLHVKKPNKFETELFEKLVPLIQLAKAEKQQDAYNLLEALIDACVMECYFREHMAERDLLFQDAIAALLKDYDPEADTASQTAYLEALHTRLQAADLPQKLQDIPEKSPDLLGVILKEGKV